MVWQEHPIHDNYYEQRGYPGSPVEFFDTVDDWVRPEDGGLVALQDWPFDQVLEFAHALRLAAPYAQPGTGSLFSFGCNKSLGGGPYPCSNLSCRRKNIRSLATFAALYADRVLIPDPFMGIEGWEEDSHWGRLNLTALIGLMREIRPLLEAGIISLAPSVFAFCEKHGHKFEREKVVLEDRLDAIADDLVSSYLDRCTFSISSLGDQFVTSVSGPEVLVPHGEHSFVGNPSWLPSKVKNPAEYELDDRDREEMLRRLVLDYAVEDVFLQVMQSSFFDTRFLSDRELEIDVLRRANPTRVQSFDAALMDALSHSLPVATGVPLEAILELRENEAEAFRVYRDALSELVDKIDKPDPAAIQDAFRREVTPHLDRIDSTIRASRERAKGEMKKNLTVVAGSVVLGVAGGLISPQMGAIIAALSGAPEIRKAGANLLDMFSQPSEIRTNDFYFLWRLRKYAGRGG